MPTALLYTADVNIYSCELFSKDEIDHWFPLSVCSPTECTDGGGEREGFTCCKCNHNMCQTKPGKKLNYGVIWATLPTTPPGGLDSSRGLSPRSLLEWRVVFLWGRCAVVAMCSSCGIDSICWFPRWVTSMRGWQIRTYILRDNLGCHSSCLHCQVNS